MNPTELAYGDRFRIADRRGETLCATFLARTRGNGAYVRLPTGAITRLGERDADWESLERLSPSAAPAGLREGDELLLESPGGRFCTTLEEPVVGATILVKLHGQVVPLPVAQLTSCRLLFKTTEFNGGDQFEVKSLSGRTYEGVLNQALPDGRLMVTLKGGRSVEIKVERLEMATFTVLIEIPTARLGLAELQAVSDEVLLEDAEDLDAETAKEELKRARASTARLKRQLLAQQDELVKAKGERSTLESEVRKKERALESEVWRGLATNRDLAQAKRLLEETRGDGQGAEPKSEGGSQ